MWQDRRQRRWLLNEVTYRYRLQGMGRVMVGP
jgi:hypothetical protein